MWLVGVMWFGAAMAWDPLLAEICSRAPHIASVAESWCDAEIPVCQWQYVECVYPSVLFALSLDKLSLDLQIPLHSLAETQFRVVRLTECGLAGDLASLSLSSGIDTLDLSRNIGLAGFLTQTQFQKVRALSLSGCSLEADIHDILCGESHARLVSLDISDSELTGDLSECTGATNLAQVQTFNASRNSFEGRAPIPPKSVSYDISYNQFSLIETDVTLDRATVRVFGNVTREIQLLKRCDVTHNDYNEDMHTPNWIAIATTKQKSHCGLF